MKEIRNIMICGYGVMGRGVAKSFARCGYKTFVKTRSPVGPKELPPMVVATHELPPEPPDLVIEFVPEDAAAKCAVYAEIEDKYGDFDVIIATGTSGLDLTQLARGMRRPQNFIGLHYFMPAEESLLVEVMAGPMASHQLVDLVALLVQKTGKEPVCLYRPVVGFLLNRLQHAMLHEAYYLIENGVASAADIDHSVRRLLAPRMCLNGLIKQKDISGLKIHAEAQQSIVPSLYHNGVASPMLQAMVTRGEVGLDAGKGFYDWSECDGEQVRIQTASQLQRLTDFIDRNLDSHRLNADPKPRDLHNLELIPEH
jgi:3-hydroxybutyryl-CoA dehydrogenase